MAETSTEGVCDNSYFIVLCMVVYPDPPVGMNWTILSVGMTKMYTDVLISWETPPSAATVVEIGWLNLVYEAQYRETGSATWNTVRTSDLRIELKVEIFYNILFFCKILFNCPEDTSINQSICESFIIITAYLWLSLEYCI